MTLAVQANPQFPPVFAQYESDRAAVAGLMAGLQGRIRELEREMRDQSIQKLQEAGVYEVRIAELAEQLEERTKQYDAINRVAAEQLEQIKRLTTEEKQAGEEGKRAALLIHSLQAQLAEKNKQMVSLVEQCQGATKRCEELQQKIVQMATQHHKQLEKNNEMLAKTSQALAQRVQAPPNPIVALVNGVVNVVASWFFCKPKT